MSPSDTCNSGTDRLHTPRMVAPTDVPVYLHRLGGRDTDGSQSVLTRWTFEAEQFRSVVEDHLSGRVLNATAGKTRLDHDNIVRNDINPEMPADTHYDVQAADEHWPVHSFDGIVLDPPFDEGQADQRYGGWHASDFSAAREALEPLVRPGGKAISLGWTTYGFAEQFDGWQREEIHIYQRGPVHPDVFLTVDEKVQQTLLADGGNVEGRINREKIPDQYSDLPTSDREMDSCTVPMGHNLNPVNDEKGGPQTRMVCILCHADRLVTPGDLDKFHGEYPEWCDTTSTGTDQEAGR